MSTIIISRSYRHAVATGTDFLLFTGPDILRHLSNDSNRASDSSGSRCYWRRVPPLLRRQALPSQSPPEAQHHYRPKIFSEVLPVNWNRLRNPHVLIDSSPTYRSVRRTIGRGNCITLKRTLPHERRCLSRAISTEERGTEKKIISDDRSEKTVIDTRLLNHQATKAIISQLSSPPNLLTLSRILATPYLSYMLISDNRKNIITPSTIIEGDTLAAAASSPLPFETVPNSTMEISADATSTIFANLDQLSTPEVALILFLVMGFTDFLDGYIARAYPSTATVLGTYLDPIADKVFIGTLSLTLWYIGSLPGLLVGLWIARDVGIVGSVYWLVRKETIRIQNCKNHEHDSNDSNAVAVMDPQNTPLKVQASFTSKVNTTLQIGLIALGIAGEVPSIEIPPMLMTSLIWITAGTTFGSSLGYLDGSAMKNAKS